MNKRAQLELSLLAAAVFMGVLGDLLLRTLPWGLNFFLWMAALLAALLILGPARPEAFAGSGRLLILPLILFSLLFLWHDSPVLKMLNVLALLVALSLIVWRAQGGRIRFAGIVEYVLGSVIAGLNAAFGLFPLLLGKAEWKKLFGDRGPKRALAVARGLLFFFPLLLLFGGLFMAADAVFKELVQNTLRLNLRLLFTHFFVAVSCAWLVGGYLRGVLLGDEWPKVAEPRLPALSLGIIEISVVLGLLDLLFLFFVLVQFRYFFGGAALVQATTGLTYAEYARRGFFELVAVAALALPLLLIAHWLLGEENPKAQRLFRGLAAAQILLLFVIMISAFQRMRLYQAEYGLSVQRLYPTAFMGWLAMVFVWFAVTVLRGRREQFWFGAMIAGFVLIVVLHVLDPDALIARTNIARARAGRRFDARYVTLLSADAVPELVAGLADLSPQDRCGVAAGLLGRWLPPADGDWRAWNRSRTQAWSAVGGHEATLRALSCTEQKK
jgi:hypothetical protein